MNIQTIPAFSKLPAALQAPVEQQWQSWLAADGDPCPALVSEIADTLPAVWSASNYVAKTCIQHPQWLARLMDSGDLLNPALADEWPGRMQALLEPVADMAGLQQVLRQFRNQMMVRIIWRDIAGWATLSETTRDLSLMAETCINGAIQKLYQWQCAEFGTPVDEYNQPMRMVVLGMGKLGAYELNMSSDIDLIFAYREDGEINGDKPLTHSQFFIKLGQKLIQALDTMTADGFVFRVDMRLRPFGESGALAASFSAIENYYQTHGREWERYALIKARVVSGDQAAGAELMETLRPFIYRRYLDYGAYDSLREMKAMIAREVKRKSLEHNVKLGAGGIREIEFIAQVFQLIRGGRDRALQKQSLFAVLDHLAEQACLPAAVIHDLKTAYIFLRTTEHRLQEVADQQTHVLPQDEFSRLRLAVSMGFADWSSFIKVLNQHRKKVEQSFASVFEAPQTEQQLDQNGQQENTQQVELASLWHTGLEDEHAADLLTATGYNDTAELLRRLLGFRYGHCYRALSSTGRKRLDQLMPLILGAAIQTDLPDVTLIRLLDLLENIAQRSVYLALLTEYPLALSQLVKLCGASPWIAQYLGQHPILLDELLDPRSLYAPPDKFELVSSLRQQIQAIEPMDLEQAMDSLRHFKHSNVLRVAAADLVGALPLMKVSDHLSWIAETVLEEALSLAWDDLLARHGQPVCGAVDVQIGSEQTSNDNPQVKNFAVIAYGKLGGLELGYGSDLDLVFLHDCGSVDDMTRTETQEQKALSIPTFYARLGQRLIHFLSALTPAGKLYEVDMRLRPDGASGLLVSGLHTYATYQHEKAWTWEHQALVRARPVAGDAALAQKFIHVRQTVLCQARDRVKLREDIISMRQRMRKELAKSSPGLFDLKQGEGGIVDIEFMVQYAALGWAHQYPELAVYTDNIRILEQIAKTGLMVEEDVQLLNTAYKEYRHYLHHMALQEQGGLIADSAFQEYRKQVSNIWNNWLEAG